MKTTTRPDVYARVTARIVEQLEAGVRPWFRPWNATHKAGSISRPLRNTGQPYQGVNVLVLWLTAFERGYTCPIWLTFNQAKDAGGSIKKGEKGTTVVYANTFERAETDEATGEVTTERIGFLKSYIVFNAEQVEGLPGHYYAPAERPKNLGERLTHAEAFLAADLGLTPDVMPDHADYLACWLNVLKADKRAIFTAASHASKAAEYLHGLQPIETEEIAPPPGDTPAPLDPLSLTPATDPDACYREMAEAMNRYDLATARERSHELREWLARGGKYPQDYTRAEVDSHLRAVLARTVYPD